MKNNKCKINLKKKFPFNKLNLKLKKSAQSNIDLNQLRDFIAARVCYQAITFICLSLLIEKNTMIKYISEAPS